MSLANELSERLSKISGPQTIDEEVKVKSRGQTFIGDFFREMTREIVEGLMEGLQNTEGVSQIYTLGDFEYDDQSVSTYVHVGNVDYQSGRIQLIVPIQTNQSEDIIRKEYDLRTTLSDVVDDLQQKILNILRR